MPDPQLQGIFHRPFAEQLAAFRLRLGDLVPTTRWDDLRHSAHDRAFMVAGATKADLLADLAQAVDKAIEKGTTLEEFRRDFRQIVDDHGWHGWTGEGTKGGRAWRTRVIYRTNMKTSYAAGRWAQLMEGGFKYGVYRHGGSLEPREQHLAWDGLILPIDHPFWQTHAPPNGWGCSCYVLGARSIKGAVRLGGNPSVKLPPDWDKIDPRTGAPAGIDKGWAYAPGASVSETVRLGAEKIRKLPAVIGSDFGAGIQGIIERAWPLWLADTQVGGSHAPGLLGFLRREEIEALSIRDLTPETAEIMLRPGIVAGAKARRHEAKGDALSAEDWLSLPSRIKQPEAVLLDMKSGNLVYLLSGDHGRPQLAVQMDYYKKGAKHGDRLTNMVVSTYYVSMQTIRSRLKGGQLVTLSGKVPDM